MSRQLFSCWSLVVIAAVLTPITIRPPYANRPHIRSDGVGYHLWTHAIVRGDLNFKRYDFAFEWGGIDPSDPERGFYHNKYGPGVAIIRLPVMIFLVDWTSPKPQISRNEHGACLVLSALALLAIGYCGLRTCRLFGTPDWAANLAVLAVIFGSGLFHYATYDASFCHIWAALGLMIFLQLGLTALNTQDGRLLALPTVMVVLLLVLTRNTNALAIAIMSAAYGVEVVRRRQWRSKAVWRNFALVAGAGLVGISIQTALNSNAYGRFCLSAYGREEFLWDRPMQFSVLFSLRHGLLVFYPILGVVLLGGLCVRTTWPATLAYAALLLGYVFLYGYWECWWLGAGFGHRGFVDVMPLGIPLLAVALARSGMVSRTLLIAGSLVAICFCLELLVGIWSQSLNHEFVTREDYLAHLFGKSSFFRFLN